MAKRTLFICAIILASAYAYPKNVSDNPDDCIDIIKAIVYVTEALIDLLLEYAPNFIDDIDENWPDVHELEVDIASGVLYTSLDIVDDRIQTWSENSTDAGKKLANCIIDSRDDAVAVPVDFINKTLECSGDDFIAFVKTLPTLIDDLTDVQIDAKRAADKINNCVGHDVSTVLCVLDVVSELVDVAKILVIKTHNHIKPVADQWKVFVNSTINCGKDNIDIYNVAGSKWLQKVSNCVTA
ncbi:uncharacterized protein [Diabrotica undecimpunctata]|uniref:uncharacterized protein n=1 Tax=Diabrotica undecimpunctata TaxID=50387 RepID=UPI003B634B9C